MRPLFYLLFCVLTLGNLRGYAQKWELGATAGVMAYTGDLNQQKFYDFNHSAFGGMLKRNFDGYWSVKLSALFGEVSAKDADSKYEEQRNRNLSFFSPISETSLQVEFNFFDYGLAFGQKRFTPFIFTGISAFKFNPKTKLNGDTYELKYYATELDQIDGDKYKTVALAIPLGAGVKYKLTKNLNIIGEFGFRTTNTDYLDDVSGRYIGNAAFDTNSPDYENRTKLADPSVDGRGFGGYQRGDFRKKDTYLFAGITLSYTFVRQNCPF